MIGYRQYRTLAPQRPLGNLETLKGLRRSHFVHQVPVDIQQPGAVGILVYQV